MCDCVTAELAVDAAWPLLPTASLTDLEPGSQQGESSSSSPPPHCTYTLYPSQIANVSDSAFAGLGHTLQELSLRDNELWALPGRSLSRLLGLTVLDLAHNNLRSLPSDVFRANKELYTLVCRMVGHGVGPHAAAADLLRIAVGARTCPLTPS